MKDWTESARVNTVQVLLELTQAVNDLSNAMTDGGHTPPEVVLLALSEIRDLIEKAESAVGLDVRVETGDSFGNAQNLGGLAGE